MQTPSRWCHFRPQSHLAFHLVLVLSALGAWAADAVPPKPERAGGKAKAPPTGATAEPGVRLERDVAFLAPERSEKMDIYLPAAAKSGDRFPCLVFIHGGGFTMGDKAAGSRFCNAFVRKGYVCASINYHLASGHARYEAFEQSIPDCKTAIRFLRANASKYFIDSQHFGAFGSSAGGYFVTMLGYAKASAGFEPKDPYGEVSSEIQAVVDLFGLEDFTADPDLAAGAQIQEHFRQIHATWPKEKQSRYSPIEYVTPDSPPTLVSHGTKDDMVAYTQSERLVAALKRVHVPWYFIPVPGAGHGYGMKAPGMDLEPAITAFYDKYLKGKAVEVPGIAGP